MNVSLRVVGIAGAAGLVAVAGSYVAGRAAGGQAARREALEERAAVELLGQGAAEAQVGKPRIEGTPAGATPVATITTRNDFEIDRRRSAGGAPGATAGAPEASGPSGSNGRVPGQPDAFHVEPPPATVENVHELPPWPAAGDLACDATTDVWTIGQRVFTRAACTARLQGPRGGVLYTRGPLFGVEHEATVSPSILPPTWSLEVLVGASIGSEARPGLEVGVARVKRHLGWYVMADYSPQLGGDPASWRAHGGLVWRPGR
jgi:hypothetical protein